MRAIEREAVAAFNANKDFKKSNTQVVATSQSVYVYLHGNLIVWKDRTTGEVSYNHCGWNTPTTASRLRAFGADAHIKNGTIIIK
jgi:hypothetical protein